MKKFTLKNVLVGGAAVASALGMFGSSYMKDSSPGECRRQLTLKGEWYMHCVAPKGKALLPLPMHEAGLSDIINVLE